jgi:predicted nucleic acid-binding protein
LAGGTACPTTVLQAVTGRWDRRFRLSKDFFSILLELIESTDFGTSAQVLQEFFVTVVSKASRPLSAAQALEWIEQWTAFPCQTIDHQLVRIAIEQSERFVISYWDAAILAAAEALGTDTVYSEDLSHGQRYGRIRVLNPFS